MVWRTNIDSQPATDLDDLSETAMQTLPQVCPTIITTTTPPPT